MSRVASKDTSPEMYVRRAVHAAGFRYRLHVKKLPGCPDLVFPALKIAAFVHGCFWHWHGCKRSRMPASNNDYWAAKIGRNVARDKRSFRELRVAGWKCHVIWECDLKGGTARLLGALGRARGETQRSAKK